MEKAVFALKKPAEIPFELIGELIGKMSVEQWVEVYKANVRKS